MNKRIKIIFTLIVLLFIVIITITQSYSLFTYNKKGNVKNKITTAIYKPPIEMEIKTYTVEGKVYADVNTYSETTEIDYIDNGTNKIYLPNSIENKKIYVIPTTTSTWYTDSTDYQTLLSDYKTVTVGNENTTAEEIISNNYDIVIISHPYWAINDLVDTLFQNNIDIITIGDDCTQSSYPLKIFDTSNQENTNIDGIINTSIDNIITKRLNFNNLNTGTGRSSITFIDDVEVWYQDNSNGNISDTIGYYNNNGVQLIHAQYTFNAPSDIYNKFITEAVNFIAKKDIATFEITTSGDHTFTAVNKLGQKVSQTIYIDTTAPVKPTFINKTSSTNNVSLKVSAEDNESNISKITCYYGDSANNITNIGSSNNDTCSYPSTASYAKVCIKNEVGLESCSDPKQLAIYFIKDGIMLEDFNIFSANTTYTNQNGYINLILTAGSRTGIYTNKIYNTSNYQYAYVDISWNLTSNDLSAQPSFELYFTDNGNFFANTGTVWKTISIFWREAGNFESPITTPRTLYSSSIPINTYSNTTIGLGKNHSPINYDANVYNIWVQLTN